MSAHRGKFVAYFRVSTDKQGNSGLGLEAAEEFVKFNRAVLHHIAALRGRSILAVLRLLAVAVQVGAILRRVGLDH
jgi:hypothetical protein